jgi:hypothetical protein
LPNEFNLHFTYAAAGSGSDEVIYGFVFSCVKEAVVFNVIIGLKADADPTNIFPVCSKGIERILCDQFVKYIESCGLLSRFQFGIGEKQRKNPKMTCLRVDF